MAETSTKNINNSFTVSGAGHVWGKGIDNAFAREGRLTSPVLENTVSKLMACLLRNEALGGTVLAHPPPTSDEILGVGVVLEIMSVGHIKTLAVSFRKMSV